MATRWIEINNLQKSEIQNLPGVRIKKLPIHFDSRGSLHELWRQDEIPAGFNPMMACASWSQPGIQRGPHEHVEQDDYFIFSGPSDFLVALWDARPGTNRPGQGWTLQVGESNPVQLHVPHGVVHGYRNIGQAPGLVVTVTSSLFQGPGRINPVDEIRHENDPNSPYQFPSP